MAVTTIEATRTINNLAWTVPLDVCDYASSCKEEPLVIVSSMATNAPAPTTMERRPLCGRHASDHTIMLCASGVQFRTFTL